MRWQLLEERDGDAMTVNVWLVTGVMVACTSLLSSAQLPPSDQWIGISQFELLPPAFPPRKVLTGIASGPDGALWFTEAMGAFGRIATDGSAVTEFPLSPTSYPRRITRGPDGALWFLEAHAIGRITTNGLVSEFPLTAPDPPIGMTSGPDGAVWFTRAA